MITPIKKSRVLVDVDGVLADFLSAAISVINKVTGQSFKNDDVTDWDIVKSLGLSKEIEAKCDDVYKAKGYALSLNPYEGSQEAIAELNDIADLYIVTAPIISETWMHDRLRWLEDVYMLNKKQVIFAYNKHVVCGDILVDDKPSNVSNWLLHNPDGNGILWHQTYNSTATNNHTIRTNDWNVVISAVKQHVKK